MNTRLLSASALLFAAAHAFAGGTITNGNASLQIVGNMGSNIPNANVATDAGGPDQMAQLCWYYRTQNNNQNSVMSNLDTPVENYAGNTATLTWTNAGPGPVGTERFDATLMIVLEDGPTPDLATVTQTMVFKASAGNAAPRVYQIFNLVDLDLSASASDDSISMTAVPLRVARQTESSSSNEAFMQGEAATAFEVNSGGALRAKFNGGAQNLSNAIGPVNGDSAAAFQWTATLNPGQSITLVSRFTINRPLPLPVCYANCDASAVAPILNVNDFSCFLNLFAAGDTRANCDQSTVPPVLNVNDFSCFLNAFAAGCP